MGSPFVHTIVYSSKTIYFDRYIDFCGGTVYNIIKKQVSEVPSLGTSLLLNTLGTIKAMLSIRVPTPPAYAGVFFYDFFFKKKKLAHSP